ncbi:hypothetical protein [Candidatus Enterococcus ikei]|uniref:Tetratricopeptide repeat protein n=1 Tax=Candidatus Enterococcus ikei TaxID=2815326 RepID=A0ABS3H1G7_9ENTE|nr:hypothetical protein [Enterococcus sp. DIV0869a]MBO0440529.1 hypothetical protein [Enterococcus sp. DIV0869a]
MAIQFQFEKTSNMRVPLKEPLPLSQAEALLEKENSYAVEEQSEMTFTYSLLNEDDVDVVQFSYKFPEPNFSLLGSIIKELPTFSEEEQEVIVPWLEEGFGKKIRRAERPLQIQAPLEQTQPVPKNKKNKKSILAKFFKRQSKKQAEVIVEASNDQQIVVPMQRSIVQPLNQEIMQRFETALDTENYPEAIRLYEGYTAILSGRNELIAAGYCYLRTDQLQKAKTVNQGLISSALTQDILVMDQLQALVKASQEKLSMLQLKPLENVEEIQELTNQIVLYTQEMEGI